MRPELFTIPILDWPVKSYGVMLTVGFLSAIWLSIKRSERMKMDPDVVLNISMVCLVCGVVFARVFYVAHYWSSSFKYEPKPLMAALNFTQGGLEYYGGLIGAIVGAMVYMAIKKVSIRMYTDLLAPATAFGLAFGRIGCLLNGCCWGGICVDAAGHQTVPWGISFPHGSPAQMRQWENRQLTLPAELLFTARGLDTARPVSASAVNMPVEERQKMQNEIDAMKQKIEEASVGGDNQALDALRKQFKALEHRNAETLAQMAILRYSTSFPSREDPKRDSTVTEIQDLAAKHGSALVHPAQIYASINALIISWVLLEILYRRKRHGVVFAWLCILYPITRIILEMVRVDNPHDSAGLTISQAVSLGMIAFGIVWLLVLYRMPLRSPRAIPYVPPQCDTPSHKAATAGG